MLAPMFGTRPVRGGAAGVRVAVAALLLLPAASACGGVGQPAPYDATGIDELEIPSPAPDPAHFVTPIDHEWLAWQPGHERTFDVLDDGRAVGTMTVSVAAETVEVGGVDATVVTERVHQTGGSVVESTGLYAQDDDGHVWMLGAASSAESWSVEDGSPAGLLMPAQPRVGDGWALAAPRHGDARTSSVLGRVTVTSPRREWQDALETTYDEAHTEQRRYYASGVGLVRVVDLDAGLTFDLVEPPPG